MEALQGEQAIDGKSLLLESSLAALNDIKGKENDIYFSPSSDQELFSEILENLRRKEAKYYVFNPKAKYIKFRRVVVDWMCEVGEEYKLSSITVQMAISYLDRILSAIDVSKKKLQLVSMCCLLVAAKYEEKDDNVPTIEQLNECSENTYTTELIKEMELMVLGRLEWNLGVVVPNHFLKHYQTQGIVFATDKIGGKKVSARAVKYLKKYLDFFADLCQQEHSFQEYLPSVLAAGIIACARTALKFEPIWNTQLQVLTNHSQITLLPCYLALWKYYEKNFPAQQTSSTTNPGVMAPLGLAVPSPYSPSSPITVSPHAVSPSSSIVSQSPTSPFPQTPTSPPDLTPTQSLLLPQSEARPSKTATFHYGDLRLSKDHTPLDEFSSSVVGALSGGSSKSHRFRPYHASESQSRRSRLISS